MKIHKFGGYAAEIARHDMMKKNMEYNSKRIEAINAGEDEAVIRHYADLQILYAELAEKARELSDSGIVIKGEEENDAVS